MHCKAARRLTLVATHPRRQRQRRELGLGAAGSLPRSRRRPHRAPSPAPPPPPRSLPGTAAHAALPPRHRRPLSPDGCGGHRGRLRRRPPPCPSPPCSLSTAVPLGSSPVVPLRCAAASPCSSLSARAPPSRSSIRSARAPPGRFFCRRRSRGRAGRRRSRDLWWQVLIAIFMHLVNCILAC